MRLLVCGGRLYNNDEHANDVLEFLHGSSPLSLVMGDTRFSAVLLAKKWAEGHGVPFSEIRTLAMRPLSDGPLLPELVLAFGTSKTSREMAGLFARFGFRVLDAQTGQQVTA